MAIYDYICSDPECGHEFEAFQQDPNNPQTICPKCNKETLKKKYTSVPKFGDPGYVLRGFREAPIYKDLNKKYKKYLPKSMTNGL